MILTVDLLAQFDALIDKVESPYFTDGEKLIFLNMAQNALLKEIVDDRILDRRTNGQGAVKLEDNEIISKYLSSLYAPGISGTMLAINRLTYAEIEASPDMGGREVYYVMSMRLSRDGTNYSGAKNVAYHRLNSVLDNAKQYPKDCRPIFTLGDTFLDIYPRNAQYLYIVDILRVPLKISLAQDCDLDQILAGELVARAAEYAGIAMRDNQLVQATNMETTQKQI